MLNYTEQHFITWIKPWGSAGPFVWSTIETKSCSLASVLIASPISSYNVRAPKCFSKEARENIVSVPFSPKRNVLLHFVVIIKVCI